MTDHEPTRAIGGLDHLVIAVADLASSAAIWTGLGFTLSPQGFHGPELGTTNHTIMLGRDYIELLGVARPTPYNETTRAFLAVGDGVEHFAMASGDAEAAAAAIRAQGYEPAGAGVFGRSVTRADGVSGEARFGIARWPAAVHTAGIGLFVCQHLAPEWVWLPELVDHPNAAVGIAAVYVAAHDPVREAKQLCIATGQAAAGMTDTGMLRVGDDGRAAICFATRTALEALLSPENLTGAREEGVVAIDIRVRHASSLTAQRVQAARCNGLSIGFIGP